MIKTKIVTREGLQFKVLGSCERNTELGGRFFSCIGRDSDGWTLFEHDDITVHGSARPLGRKFERLLNTKALVAEIRRLVETGEKLPTDMRPPWEIDPVHYEANQTALIAARQGKPETILQCLDCYVFYKGNGATACPTCGKLTDRTDGKFNLKPA